MQSRPALLVLVMSAVLVDCCGILPMGVVAARAVDIATVTGEGEFPGLLTTAYFLCGAVTAATVGRRLDRIGARRMAILAGAVTAGLALPLLAETAEPRVMLAGVALAGGAFSLTLPATNAVLGRALPTSWLLTSVGVKQAAIPAAMLLVAAAHPVVAAWSVRELFLAADIMAVLVLTGFVIASREARARHILTRHADPPVATRFARYAIATMMGSVLAGALIGYGTITLHHAGLSEGLSATVLSAANLSGLVTRVLSGVVMQRLKLASWWPVAVMTWCGALGAIGLAAGRPASAITGALLAFSLGWGWSGLAFALVLLASGPRSGATGAMLQAGGMLGTALGPLGMAGAVSAAGLSAGWLLVAGAMVVAGGLVVPRRPPTPASSP